MSKDSEALRRAVGREVEAVVAEVLFYSAEMQGALGNVLLTFTEGTQLSFGCAGDGSVSVTRTRGSIGDAPGYSTVLRTIPGLSGTMETAEHKGKEVRLGIGGQELLLTNLDDELTVALDGKHLPKETFIQGV